MEQIPLAVTTRTETKKGAARRLRAEGMVPAVIYGAGKGNTLLSVAVSDLIKVFKQAGGTTAFLALNVEGEGTPRLALMHEVQADTLGRKPVHVDFLEIRPDQEQVIEVPLEFVGTPAGAEEGGVMTVAAYTLAVRGLLAAIPDSIEVDVSGLNINDSIFAEDISVPGDVRAVIDENHVVVSVQPPTLAALPEEEAEGEELEGEEAEGEAQAEGSEAEAKEE